MSIEIYTIGHSTHSMGKFLDLLNLHGINAVADVRSAPYSRFNPHFNREDLQRVLAETGIKYVFLGKELGARSDDPSCYEGDKVQYPRLARTELFRKGIDRVLEGAAAYRVSLMCAEKDPLQCHRTILVARELVGRGATVKHIMPDGSLEPHTASLQRLRFELGMPENDLFRSDEELVEEAYAKQSDRIAYDRSATRTKVIDEELDAVMFGTGR